MYRPLIVCIPSYDRHNLLSRTVDSCKKIVRPDDLLVLEQMKGNPLGSGEARRRLCLKALEKHGPDCYILNLDDDAEFYSGIGDRNHILWACEHFQRPDVGAINLPNSSRPTSDSCDASPFMLFHAPLITGKVIASGQSYRAEDYSIDTAFTFRMWLAGWTLMKTQRAKIRQHASQRGRVSKLGGGREGAFADGLRVRDDFLIRYRDTGLVTCEVGERDGVFLPEYLTVKPTRKGRELHKHNASLKPWERV